MAIRLPCDTTPPECIGSRSRGDWKTGRTENPLAVIAGPMWWTEIDGIYSPITQEPPVPLDGASEASR